MAVKYTVSHAAPYIRQKLCYAVYAANNATTQRDMRAKFAEAFAYADALKIMARADDQTPVAGIADEEHLPSTAVKLAREWLKTDADKILGESDAQGN